MSACDETGRGRSARRDDDWAKDRGGALGVHLDETHRADLSAQEGVRDGAGAEASLPPTARSLGVHFALDDVAFTRRSGALSDSATGEYGAESAAIGPRLVYSEGGRFAPLDSSEDRDQARGASSDYSSPELREGLDAGDHGALDLGAELTPRLEDGNHSQGEPGPRSQLFAGLGRSGSSNPGASLAGKSRTSRAKPIRWVLVSGEAGPRDVVMDKYNLREMTGVPPRDLRVMDPTLAYPSSIMIRDRALVVNLEHVKAIITADFLLVQQLDNPLLAAFMTKVVVRLGPGSASRGGEGDALGDAALRASLEGAKDSSSTSTVLGGIERAEALGALKGHSGEELGAHQRRILRIAQISSALPTRIGGARGAAVGASPASARANNNGAANTAAVHNPRAKGRSRSMSPPAKPKAGPVKRAEVATVLEDAALPFEVRALELCLQEVSDRLTNEVDALVRSATPVFDRLTHGVSRVLLETARRMKTQVARMENKIENVHDELEKLLDSETELQDMCLSVKHIVAASRGASPHLGPVDLARRTSMEANMDQEVEDLENMVEAYFEQIDGSAKKLQELRDYIANTEDYVAIELDSHRNQLIQLELFLTIGALCMSIYAVIGGLFGMNMQFAPEDALNDDGVPGRGFFFAVVGSGLAATLIVFAGIVAYCRWKRLMFV